MVRAQIVENNPGNEEGLQWSHVFSDMVRELQLYMNSLGVNTASMEPCLFRHGKGTYSLVGRSSVVTGFNGAMSFQTW